MRPILYAQSALRKGDRTLLSGVTCSEEAIGKRIKEIRGRRNQVVFLADLRKRTGHRLSQSQLSRKETGASAITACDIAAIAVMDSQQRGREWLAFGVLEARKGRATSAPYEEFTAEVESASHLRVAEVGPSDRAKPAPSESPTLPIRRKAKRKA